MPIDLNDPRSRLIVALDFPSAGPARRLLRLLGDDCRWVKVGMELYYAEGNDFVQELRALGYEVFLDLKLHDIPNTVAGAVRSATRAGASLLTLHASGGAAMMESAVTAAAQTPEAPKLLAVTVLTSMDASQLGSVGVTASPAEQVLRLARLAWAAGIRGMVCSAEEVSSLRREFGAEAELVVPGIRAAGAETGDQKRIATPDEAIRSGASRLVIGRPVTQADDPQQAIKALMEEVGSVP